MGCKSPVAEKSMISGEVWSGAPNGELDNQAPGNGRNLFTRVPEELS